MILAIDYKPEDVLSNKNGRIVLKLNYYSQYAIGCHLWTTQGNKIEDFESNKAKGKTIFVGGNGGITF